MNHFNLHALNFADYVIITIVVFSTLISLLRGFISEAISLLTWIVAVVAAVKSAGPMSNLLANVIHTPSLRFIVAFVFVLIIVLIIGSLINHFFTVFVRTTGLSGTNRLLGMIFGFARGILLVAIFILFARMTSLTREAWWHTSVLIPYFMGITNWLQQFIPVQLTHFSHYIANPKAGNP